VARTSEVIDVQAICGALLAFLKAEDGPTAVEYAIMLALIVLVCIVSITSLGTNANKAFTTVSKALGGTSS
jgi:pilus assembly protein Flp/PilA